MDHPRFPSRARICLIVSFCIAFALLVLRAYSSPTPGVSGNHFKNSSPNPLVGDDDGLRTPLEFEAALASRPDANAKVFVSRCRFAPFTNPSLYTPFGGTQTSDAIVGDTQFSFADGTHCFNPQNESNIVVNPTNPNNVVTSANEYRFDGDSVYVSMDGGQTFIDVVLPGRTGATGGQGVFARLSSCGDPVLAFAPNGTLYYAGLGCNFRAHSTASAVSVSVSHDGGMTWGAPHMVHFTDPNVFFNDKEWISVGPDGTVYVTWTRFQARPPGLFGFGSSPIVISASHDGGNTWSALRLVSDPSHPFNQGSQPQVAPDGTLYVAYEGATPSTGFFGDAIIVARSTDGGKNFTNSEVARAYDDFNCYPFNVAQGRQTLSGEQFRINSFPSFAIDPTSGNLAITWADDQANPGCGFEKGGSFVGPTSNQVKLITSSDGMTWSSPQVVTTGAEDKVYSAVGFNAGRLIVTYYTRAYSPDTDDCHAQVQDTVTGALSFLPGPVCLDYAARSSSDGFAAETRFTTQSSNPYITFAGAFIGDYTGAAVDANTKGFAAWADFRGNPGVTNPNMDVDVQRGY